MKLLIWMVSIGLQLNFCWHTFLYEMDPPSQKKKPNHKFESRHSICSDSNLGLGSFWNRESMVQYYLVYRHTAIQNCCWHASYKYCDFKSTCDLKLLQICILCSEFCLIMWLQFEEYWEQKLLQCLFLSFSCFILP